MRIQVHNASASRRWRGGIASRRRCSGREMSLVVSWYGRAACLIVVRRSEGKRETSLVRNEISFINFHHGNEKSKGLPFAISFVQTIPALDSMW